MKRIRLTDCIGWFDRDAAVEFSAACFWDGNNHIDVNTSSQWAGERIYYTRSGKWILNIWSSYNWERPEQYIIIDESTALDWLITNEHYSAGECPPKIQEKLQKHVTLTEI
jgi:hypothetical protein